MLKKHLTVILAAAGVLIGAQASQAEELRIGFINVMTGGGAILGVHAINGWKLGLEHEGWNANGKLGGVPVKMFYGDTQRKVDVGLRVTRKMLRSDKVHIVAGVTFSNILAAVQRPVVRSKRIMMSTNAGWSGMAGKACSKYFITTSWNNDMTPEAMGQLMRDEGLRNVFLLSANYQAGKDMLTGFKRYYKGGKIAGRILYKLGTRDFQAEISRIKAAKPDSVMAFAPGGMGIAFVKQWTASGAGKTIKLFTVFSIDWLTLGPIGKAAIGTYHTNYWAADDKRASNQRFWKGYIAKHKKPPSHFAAQAYDGPRLIAAALKKQGGFDGNTLKLNKTMRKVKYDSIRGPYTYNVNGIPIQNFYKREVIAGPDGKPMIVTRTIVFRNHKDAYWRKCKLSERH